MTICDYVVVLCPSSLNENGEFDELAPDGLYLGGQVRMRAAVSVYNDAELKVRKLIVIGGGVQEPDETSKWKKVKDMRYFLMKNGVPREDIICIASEANTAGNFRALWKEYSRELQEKTIGILTNSYHLPRAMRIAQDAQFDWRAKFVPICAESVIASVPPNDPAVIARIIAEAKGLNDWERGEYRNQAKSKSDWTGEVLAAQG